MSEFVSLGELEAIRNQGERVTHLWADECYFAHLSIYAFARPLVQGKRVLDAGCGAGYGSAYLIEQGAARVEAIDIDPQAIQFCREHFPHPNLRYQAMDLEQIRGFEPHSFDVIFSSNVLEHVPHVLFFFRHAWRLLKRDGVLFIAVPPVNSPESRQANIENIFHLNIWTPRQWHFILSQFFEEVHCYTHTFEKPGLHLDFSRPPEQVLAREEDFTFKEVDLTGLEQPTLTMLYSARRPRPGRWFWPLGKLKFVDDSFTRLPANAGSQGKPTLGLRVRKAAIILSEQGPDGLVKNIWVRFKSALKTSARS